MQAELDALNKASMCVGTCQGWGSASATSPVFGNGGKPGSGVGTWADENSGWGYDGHRPDHWDNTGVVRPDMTAKASPTAATAN